MPNLLTALAGLLPDGDNAATDMLRVGALGVFLHSLAYYILGRCLFRSPSLAALLSILMSIAVHWSFGTFWGSMRSDPVPRIFYADLWPFLLLLACAAVKRPSLQPVVMFLSAVPCWCIRSAPSWAEPCSSWPFSCSGGTGDCGATRA